MGRAAIDDEKDRLPGAACDALLAAVKIARGSLLSSLIQAAMPQFTLHAEFGA
jgi:hypothetical protein